MNSLDSLDEEILEVERLLGLSTRQLVRTRLVLLLSDFQQVGGIGTHTEAGVRKSFAHVPRVWAVNLTH